MTDKLERAALLEDTDDNDDHLLDDHKVNSIKPSNLTDTKISKLKSQVDGVVLDMKANIDRVVDRGTSIMELSDRSEQLGVTADTFNKRSRGLKRNMYFRTFRQRMYLLLTIGFILFLILFFVYRSLSS